MAERTVLVTGGAGFIGSNFVQHIIGQHPEWRVVVLDKLTYSGNRMNLQQVGDHRSYRFLQGDIADPETVDRLFADEGFDVVVNFAAESHVDRSILDAAPFIETNVRGTQVLLDAARAHWQPDDTDASGNANVDTSEPRFIQISTDEAYGSLGEEGRFSEASPLRPNSPYAASKASADLFCRAYNRTYGLPVIITRSSNNYGPYQYPEKLIPLMIFRAQQGRSLPVYGDGSHVREWLHVEDHCRAIDQVLYHGQPGETYNIGSSAEMPNIEIVKLILDMLDSSHSLIEFVKDRPGHDRRYALDWTRMRRELSWEPRYDFRQGLEQTIDWYASHEDWVKEVTSSEFESYLSAMYG